MPSPITPSDRQRAMLMDRERRRIENEYLRHAQAIGYELRVNIARAFRRGRPIQQAIRDAFHDLRQPLADAMLWGHIFGSRRSLLHIEREAPADVLKLDRKVDSLKSIFDQAMRFLNTRDLLTEEQRESLETRYNAASLRVLTKAQAWAQDKVSAAMRDIAGQGLHVKAGMEQLRTALDAAGLTGVQDNTLETLVRTQTQLAYGAGQAAVDSQPAIRSILWGYTYCTTHDDRVRLKHQAMEGVTLPKDHPWWDTHWPPCGYNCRCILLSRLFDRPGDTHPPEGIRIIEPRAKLIVGQMVEPEPDEGFGARPTWE